MTAIRTRRITAAATAAAAAGMSHFGSSSFSSSSSSLMSTMISPLGTRAELLNLITRVPALYCREEIHKVNQLTLKTAISRVKCTQTFREQKVPCLLRYPHFYDKEAYISDGQWLHCCGAFCALCILTSCSSW